MNSEGFFVPLTKYEFGDTERSILENLNINIERNILNLTQNFLNNSKIHLRIQIIPARHSFPWKTTF